LGPIFYFFFSSAASKRRVRVTDTVPDVVDLRPGARALAQAASRRVSKNGAPAPGKAKVSDRAKAPGAAIRRGPSDPAAAADDGGDPAEPQGESSSEDELSHVHRGRRRRENEQPYPMDHDDPLAVLSRGIDDEYGPERTSRAIERNKARLRSELARINERIDRAVVSYDAVVQQHNSEQRAEARREELERRAERRRRRAERGPLPQGVRRRRRHPTGNDGEDEYYSTDHDSLASTPSSASQSSQDGSRGNDDDGNRSDGGGSDDDGPAALRQPRMRRARAGTLMTRGDFESRVASLSEDRTLSLVTESRGKVKVLIVDYYRLCRNRESVLRDLRLWFESVHGRSGGYASDTAARQQQQQQQQQNQQGKTANKGRARGGGNKRSDSVSSAASSSDPDDPYGEIPLVRSSLMVSRSLADAVDTTISAHGKLRSLTERLDALYKHSVTHAISAQSKVEAEALRAELAAARQESGALGKRLRELVEGVDAVRVQRDEQLAKFTAEREVQCRGMFFFFFLFFFFLCARFFFFPLHAHTMTPRSPPTPSVPP
jgi:hypothetical protein